MRNRLKLALGKKVTMPRWAIGLDFVYRAFLVVGAIVVIVLWWQAATRDEEADRNARIQSCSSVFAATYSAWDSQAVLADQHADSLFARLVRQASGDGPLPADLLEEYEAATVAAEEAASKAQEMASRRIGLGLYSAASVVEGNAFQCPELPSELMVEPIEP